MSRKDEQKARETTLAANKTEIAASEAHFKRELKLLLIPWLSFKLHMVFKRRGANGGSVTKTIYGNEHSVTYKQCLFGKVDRIVLNKLKGYTDLIRYVEQDLKGQCTWCKIYMDDGSRTFPTLCRKWHKGGLEECNDPVIDARDEKHLYFTVKDNRLVIHVENPTEENWQQLVSDALK